MVRNFDGQIHLGRIVVLNGLGTEDDGVVQRESENIERELSNLAEIRFDVFTVESKTTLFEILEQLEIEVPTIGIPFLHLDMHGCDDLGVTVRNGEKVSWVDFSRRLGKLNLATHNRMGVLSCICYGLSIISPPRLIEPAPFNLLIAPFENISNGVIMQKTLHFYSKFLGERDLGAAMASLQPEFFSFSSEHVLFYSLHREVSKYSGRRGAEARESTLSRLINRARNEGYDINDSMMLQNLRYTIKNFKAEIDDSTIDDIVQPFMCGRKVCFNANDLRNPHEFPRWVQDLQS